MSEETWRSYLSGIGLLLRSPREWALEGHGVLPQPRSNYS